MGVSRSPETRDVVTTEGGDFDHNHSQNFMSHP